MDPRDKSDDDNHSNQLNPNNDSYWQSRGYDGRPDDDDEVEDGDWSDDDVMDYGNYDGDGI